MLDNKTNELAEWDFDLLAEELEDLDFGGLDLDWGFGEDEAEEDEDTEPDDKYTAKTDIPQYEPHDDVRDISICYDREKQKELEKEIDNADIPEDIREFLRIASYRHVRFDYRKVADFYSTAYEEIQQLFEDSALVLIDFDDAIKNGYAKLKGELEASV